MIDSNVKTFLSTIGKKGGSENKKKGPIYFAWISYRRHNPTDKISFEEFKEKNKTSPKA